MALMNRTRIALVSILMVTAGLVASKAQDSQLRMIIAPNVVCRAEPSATAAAGPPFRLGDIVTATKESQGGGATWYLDDSHFDPCWVVASSTAEFSTSNPDEGLLAIFDRLEQRGEPPTFPEFVEVTNLFEDDF